MREYSSREIPEGFLDRGVAAFFGWAGAGVEELGKERILRTSAADAPAIFTTVVVVVVELGFLFRSAQTVDRQRSNPGRTSASRFNAMPVLVLRGY